MTESEIVWKPTEELYIPIFSGYGPGALASKFSDCQIKAQEDIVV